MKALIRIVLLLALSFGVLSFASVGSYQAATCPELKIQMEAYADNDRRFHAEAVEQVALYSGVLQDLHKQVAEFEGKKAVDLSVAIGTAGGLVDSLEKLANTLFERAEENAIIGQGWQDVVQECKGDAGVEALELWMAQDYEILTSTAGGFFSLYSHRVSEWISEWEQMQQNKSTVPANYFFIVETASADFAEGADLTKALYGNIEESFSTLLNDQN